VWTTLEGALDSTVECDDVSGILAAQSLFPIAMDNCDPDVTNSIKESGEFVEGDCPGSGTITNIWTVTDACGNTSVEFIQTIYILDTTAPTFTRPSDVTIYTDANCGYDALPTATGEVLNVADNCSTGLTASYEDAVDETCEGARVITRTWSVSDDCGNAASVQIQMITVIDNTAPTFTRPADITIYTVEECAYDASLSVTGNVHNATDNCSTELQATFEDDVEEGDCNGEFIIMRTWSLVDDCGNMASDQIQMITVIDNTSPTFTRPADVTIYTDEE
jgi:hypothetical protein